MNECSLSTNLSVVGMSNSTVLVELRLHNRLRNGPIFAC